MIQLPKNYKILKCEKVTKENLPKIRVSKLMPEGHGKCVRCNIKATHVITYTLEGEQHRVVNANIFAQGRMLTADHVLPRALGGTDRLSNLQLMCNKCNQKKGIKISDEEMQIIIQNRENHIRYTFKPEHMRYIIKLYPSLAPLYDLTGQEEGPAIPFRKTLVNQISKRKIVFEQTDGLINNRHPHHPMWGWVRIFERFPELKSFVSFSAYG